MTMTLLLFASPYSRQFRFHMEKWGGVTLSGDASHQKVLEEWKNEKGYVARHETHENPRSLL